MLTADQKRLYFARSALNFRTDPHVEVMQVSKIRKQSSEKYEASEIFSDEEFDADDFVDNMEVKGSQHRQDERSGWRRIEELREEQQLRDQLLDFQDWEDFDAN